MTVFLLAWDVFVGFPVYLAQSAAGGFMLAGGACFFVVGHCGRSDDSSGVYYHVSVEVVLLPCDVLAVGTWDVSRSVRIADA